MNTRREFLKSTAAAVGLAGTLALPGLQAAEKKRPIKKALMLATLGIKGSVLEKFKALKAAGFDGVEPMSHMDQDEVMKALDETGLKAASVCCNTHWAKPLSDPNPATRETGAEGVKQALRDAKRWGASSILLVPGVARNGVTYEQCFERSVAEVKKILPLAEELGVKIAVENVWNDFITKPEQAIDYMDALNSPMVGWHFDIGNVIRYAAPETWIPVLGKRILKLHIKEYGKEKKFSVKFFEGDNNWPAIMAALDKVGYTGWGISEQPSDQTKDPASLKAFSEDMDRVFQS
ncbi:MAG TPA: TIM barrel protein [Verrucomicrobiae bacterium]|nr:TIM barrel protein [Verrucomicrobiae bacterium]